jgi:hypothetical protein
LSSRRCYADSAMVIPVVFRPPDLRRKAHRP